MNEVNIGRFDQNDQHSVDTFDRLGLFRALLIRMTEKSDEDELSVIFLNQHVIVSF